MHGQGHSAVYAIVRGCNMDEVLVVAKVVMRGEGFVRIRVLGDDHV